MLQVQLEKKIKNLEQLIRTIDARTRNINFPEGHISIHRSRHSIFYTIRKKQADGAYSDERIHRGEEALAKMLSLKIAAEKLLKYYRKALKSLARISFNALKKAEAFHSRFSRDFEPFLPDELLYYPERAVRWARAEYSRNTFPLDPEQVRLTSQGRQVRSKFEAQGISCLEAMGLALRYEPKIQFKNGEFKCFDCAIMSPYTGRIIYIEFFGLMEMPSYVRETIHKFNLYEDNGIYLGVNFLPVFEYPGEPFDTRRFRAQVERMLRA